MSREDLEEKYRELEEKTERLTKLLDDIIKEFDELQNSMRGIEYFLPNTRINMDGSKEENERLATGWHPSEKGFRWGGKEKENPTLYFKVSPDRSYRLNMSIFVPEAIAKTPVKIFANDIEIDNFVSDGQVKKTVYISSSLVKSDRLKISFESCLWNPNEIDKTLDSRILSLAFNYIELKEA
jgi:hypothetical protein